jgi:hypothetical protein
VSDQQLLRLWWLRPQGYSSVVDERIRDVIAPAAADTPDLLSFFAGRRVADAGEERLLASIWSSDTALARAAGPDGLLALEATLGEGTVQLLPVAVSVRRADPSLAEPAAVLRVFRGRTLEGQLAAYVEAARQGTESDIAADAGPLELYLATDAEDRFVTVSAWTTWDKVQAATGGNIRKPDATRHADRLAAATVAHYEILPGGQLRPTAERRGPD